MQAPNAVTHTMAPLAISAAKLSFGGDLSTTVKI